MYEVVVESHFHASHHLKLYDGSWEEPHEHVWKVAVLLRSEKLDSMGVVVDFEALKPCLKKVLSEFDHGDFNEHPEFRNARCNPSTENIARLIFERLVQRFKTNNAQIVKATVWETPDASASYVSNRHCEERAK